MHSGLPGGAGTTGAAPADGGLVSIGTVLGLLREEFPDVTISKIRFLEAEGLVEPRRTPAGYRKFSAQDVERLARILRMQRDHYLPLKVIREHLEADGDDTLPPGPAAPHDLMDEVSAEGELAASTRISRAELLAAAEVEEERLAEWESYGLLTPTAEGDFDVEALTVARLITDLGHYGLEPRHLRAAKAAAEREAGLVEQMVAPLRRHRNPQTRAHAEATAREMASLSVRLHAALVQAALRTR